MNNNAVGRIRERLLAMSDGEYRLFQCKLMPTVDVGRVIGIRTPKLREYAKEISGTDDAEVFLSCLPHEFYEENNLHAFLIEKIKDYDRCIEALDRFLPYVDNWATCDSMSPKVLGKHTESLSVKINEWIESDKTYTVRFAIGMLMNLYLGEGFDISQAEAVAAVRSGEYYINMMRAWYFATALAKQYDAVLPYLTGNRLDAWTHNKTIRKAIESYRISDEQKSYLRTFQR